MYSLKFNKETSAYATGKEETDLMYLKIQNSNFQAVFRLRGYIYINCIYEQLGINWDPKQLNMCYIRNGKEEFIFDICILDDGFEVHIM